MTAITGFDKCRFIHSTGQQCGFPQGAHSQIKSHEFLRAPQEYGYVVLTGRHKVLDYSKGTQIATADNDESARLIVNALNQSVMFNKLTKIVMADTDDQIEYLDTLDSDFIEPVWKGVLSMRNKADTTLHAIRDLRLQIVERKHELAKKAAREAESSHA